jgi:hypothetical protein
MNFKRYFIVLFLTSLIFLFPHSARSGVIVHDMIALKGEEILLKAETKGKFFSKGGELVEFFIEGAPIGKNLSGGDGFAFQQFTPSKTGLYHIIAKSGKEKGKGLLLSLKKGDRIVFIDVEGSLFEEILSRTPKKGSQDIIKKISKILPVVFLRTGIFSSDTTKVWLKEQGFLEMPVVQWENGAIFEYVSEKKLKIKAVIGGKSVIESAKPFKPQAFSFEEMDDGEGVKDWEEIGKKLLK